MLLNYVQSACDLRENEGSYNDYDAREGTQKGAAWG
eukprot:CAMPEP_0197840556 /NCGR_PEP_ID=MMETSP1437-20131217/45675_1 /TAXON_ID=49252 ORGANISM="Eucampia antarctica, Strain CCMP1452" /NCGR_SAMPLE_ID=MMETSP1437 /ASSEMBLY_ACC=CAM_ASM_001096 /LENGTH=35 /DNA_ID= /DNA_START= /DNA_END= /DNA_ORIENTATION=